MDDRRVAAFGPMQAFAGVRFAREAPARRGRRHPPSAHAVAVGAARRLRCDARPGAAAPNSLRSLRSLRSDRRRRVGSRSALRAPTPGLRFSPPPTGLAPATACRAATLGVRVERTPRRLGKGAPGRAAACVAGRREGEPGHEQPGGLFVPGERPGHWPGAACPGQGVWPARAARFVIRLAAACLSAANAVSAASWATGPGARASQGVCAQRRPPSGARCGLPGCAFAGAGAVRGDGPRR